MEASKGDITCNTEQERSSSYILSREDCCRRLSLSRPRGSEASRMLLSCSRGSGGYTGDWRTSDHQELRHFPGSSSINVQAEYLP